VVKWYGSRKNVRYLEAFKNLIENGLSLPMERRGIQESEGIQMD
jgi:hypothetical protein